MKVWGNLEIKHAIFTKQYNNYTLQKNSVEKHLCKKVHWLHRRTWCRWDVGFLTSDKQASFSQTCHVAGSTLWDKSQSQCSSEGDLSYNTTLITRSCNHSFSVKPFVAHSTHRPPMCQWPSLWNFICSLFVVMQTLKKVDAGQCCLP